MPKSVIVLRVVVASPGDVKAERDAVAMIVEEVSRDTARPAQLHLELARWETDARPGFHAGGPQALIDPILNIADCDLLIGIFWSRLGTPTPTGETGTEREFQTAHKAWNEKQRPEMMLYFCGRPPAPHTDDDRTQIGMVKTFKAGLPKAGFVWPYNDIGEFKTLVARHLRLFVQEQITTIWNKDAVVVRDMLEARAKERPTIAILGRLSAHDRHDKRIEDVDGCKHGLAQIGRELANAGFRIMVYDSREDYAGNDVVRGYLDSGATQPESIRVRFPLSKTQTFPGQSSSDDVFLEEPIAQEQWEVAFIPSISESSGVLMVGNGQFTLLGGLQAIGARLPTIALAGYGGITVDVWEVLKGQRSALPSDKEISLMAKRESTAAWAAAIVQALRAQRARQEALQIWRA